MRRPLAVQVAVGVGRAAELPLVEPQLFGRTPGRSRVEHAVVRHDTLEAVGVAENPVSHVSAVAGTERAFAGFINKPDSVLSQVAMSPLESFWFSRANGDNVEGVLVKPP